jgi:hypothetical protein
VTDLVTEKSANQCKVKQYRRDRIIECREITEDRMKIFVKDDILFIFLFKDT